VSENLGGVERMGNIQLIIIVIAISTFNHITLWIVFAEIKEDDSEDFGVGDFRGLSCKKGVKDYQDLGSLHFILFHIYCFLLHR